MMCSPFWTICREIRFMIFPMSKIIDERSIELCQKLEELKVVKEETSLEVSKVNQPDMLRSLVISMQQTSMGRRK